MRALELTAGQTIADRYRLVALRGTGGTGSVWRAVQLADERECALKLLHRDTTAQRAHMYERFLREAKAASSIDSPHAVRVFDFGIDGDVPFIAMELLEGETLASRLRREGRLAPAEASRIIGQIASALGHAHPLGIVHRDLKPENIFLAHGAHGVLAKVLDFGIAKLQDEDAGARDLTQSGALLGTPRYMSPEQIEGARHVDQRADLWALAVIAFECITGQQPFQGDGLRALFASICVHPPPVPSGLCTVPRGFDAWFAKGTHRDAGKRFRTAAALARELRDVCEQELSAIPTADEPGPGVQGVAVRAAPRRSARLWLILAGAGVVAALAGWMTVHSFAAAARRELPPSAAAAPPALVVPQLQPSAPATAPARIRTAQPSATAPVRTAQPPASPAVPPKPAARRGLPTKRLDRDQPAAHRSAAPVWDLDTMLRDRK